MVDTASHARDLFIKMPEEDKLAPRYAGWEDFQAVRARLDPTGVFTNDYVERVLGPVGAARPAT